MAISGLRWALLYKRWVNMAYMEVTASTVRGKELSVKIEMVGRVPVPSS